MLSIFQRCAYATECEHCNRELPANTLTYIKDLEARVTELEARLSQQQQQQQRRLSCSTDRCTSPQDVSKRAVNVELQQQTCGIAPPNRTIEISLPPEGKSDAPEAEDSGPPSETTSPVAVGNRRRSTVFCTMPLDALPEQFWPAGQARNSPAASFASVFETLRAVDAFKTQLSNSGRGGAEAPALTDGSPVARKARVQREVAFLDSAHPPSVGDSFIHSEAERQINDAFKSPVTAELVFVDPSRSDPNKGEVVWGAVPMDVFTLSPTSNQPAEGEQQHDPHFAFYSPPPPSVAVEAPPKPKIDPTLLTEKRRASVADSHSACPTVAVRFIGEQQVEDKGCQTHIMISASVACQAVCQSPDPTSSAPLRLGVVSVTQMHQFPTNDADARSTPLRTTTTSLHGWSASDRPLIPRLPARTHSPSAARPVSSPAGRSQPQSWGGARVAADGIGMNSFTAEEQLLFARNDYSFAASTYEKRRGSRISSLASGKRYS